MVSFSVFVLKEREVYFLLNLLIYVVFFFYEINNRFWVRLKIRVLEEEMYFYIREDSV